MYVEKGSFLADELASMQLSGSGQNAFSPESLIGMCVYIYIFIYSRLNI